MTANKHWWFPMMARRKFASEKPYVHAIFASAYIASPKSGIIARNVYGSIMVPTEQFVTWCLWLLLMG